MNNFRVPKENCIVCKERGELVYANQPDRLYKAKGLWSSRMCRSCDLVWLDPAPHHDVISSLYEGYYTHQRIGNDFLLKPDHQFINFPKNKKVKYAVLRSTCGFRDLSMPLLYTLAGYFFSAIPSIRNSSVRSIGGFPSPQKAERLLDIGCGNGDYLTEMRFLGYEVSGVEIDMNAAAVATSNDIPVQVGELTRDMFPADSFNAIYMNNVIEHLPDPRETLDICHAILRKGGLLCIKTCSSKSLAHRYFGKFYRGLEIPRHLHVFSPKSLITLSEKSGFSVKEVSTSYNGYIWASSAAMKRGDGGAAAASDGLLLRMLKKFFISTFYVFFPGLGDDIFLLLEKR